MNRTTDVANVDIISCGLKPKPEAGRGLRNQCAPWQALRWYDSVICVWESRMSKCVRRSGSSVPWCSDGLDVTGK